MTIQVMVQSGSGGGLLVITTVQIDRIGFGATIQASVTPYWFVRGNTSIPQTNIQVRQGVHSWVDLGVSAVGALPSRDLFQPCKTWAIQVRDNVGGSLSTWTVELQISNNNVEWTTIATHTDAAPGRGLVLQAQPFLAFFVRANVTAIALAGGATGITILIAGVPY